MKRFYSSDRAECRYSRSQKTKLVRSIRALALSGAIVSGIGCSHLARSRSKAIYAADEHSRALTSGVVDSLHLTPAAGQDPAVDLALELARENERIQGLPAMPIPVRELLSLAPSNTPPGLIERRSADARKSLENRFKAIERLIARERDSTSKLIDYGSRFEAERSASPRRWLSLGGSSLGLLGIGVGLILFVPAAVPLLGRFLAWVVGRIPGVAGAVGIVGVKAFDAVVKGLEGAKPSASNPKNSKDTSRLSNEEPARPPSANSAMVESLHASLSRAMDSEHKALVRARKGALRL